MRYSVLACDYDGTLAQRGRVSHDTLAALERLLATGRKLVLVTGRELPELQTILPELGLFDWVVAENGALLYRPSNREEKLLAQPPPPAFVEALRRYNVAPLSVGRVVVATCHPHETTVLQTIRKQGLELHVIFNKGSVMVLPAGVTKATGLTAVLKEMGLSFHEVVGVGDAENDHAFLSLCECAVAVANALPAVKDRADLTTKAGHGAGVAELIDKLIATDLAELEGRLTRHPLLLGTPRKYAECELPPDASFYFRGPEGNLNLRAQNLMLFLQLADGVDDPTWLHHLSQGDYARWFREQIKDDGLAVETDAVARQAGVSAAQSRALIRQAVERRYTLPASAPLPMPGTQAAPKRQ